MYHECFTVTKLLVQFIVLHVDVWVVFAWVIVAFGVGTGIVAEAPLAIRIKVSATRARVSTFIIVWNFNFYNEIKHFHKIVIL